MKSTFASILETLNQRRSRHVGTEAEDNISRKSSRQSLQMRKNQFLDLQELFRRCCYTLLVFASNSGKYDINSIKSYLLPFLVSERDFEPIVIKTANQIVSFRLGNVQLLDFLNFLGGVTNPESLQDIGDKGIVSILMLKEPQKKLFNEEFPPLDAYQKTRGNGNPFVQKSI